MLLGRAGARILALIVASVLPPMGFVAWLAWGGTSLPARLGAPATVVLTIGLTIVWVTLVAVIGTRIVADAERAMVTVAGTGRQVARGPRQGRNPEPGLMGIVEQVASALEERNRQISDLSARVREMPITQDLRMVAQATVRTAASVTGDPTWELAVLRTPDPEVLPRGIYTAEDDGVPARPLDEVHRWIATMEADDESLPAVRHRVGPWGAFVSVESAAEDELRAVLLAPWEGRPTPSRADRELLGLLGQSAATALEHALLYARLRSQTDTLSRMAQLQKDFLQSVTHDLQTPLTSIAALAADTRDEDGLSDTARADLDTIGHQADRLRRMVGQLLIASRLEAGPVEPNIDVFHVEPIIRRTWAALRADRPFSLERAGEPLLTVGDPDRLEQVLWAVLDNAVKYSPPGSPVEVRVNYLAREEEPRTNVVIHDEGHGMDDETRVRAFEQFYRGAAARRSVPDGSGVGLYAARGLMQAMDGALEIASRLGEGTWVTLSLPGEPPEDEVPLPK